MRAALGARRGRLIRQLLAESAVVSTVAGVVGLGFAWATLGVLTRFVERFTQRTEGIALDPWVLLFTLGVAVATGLLFGIFPALATRTDVLGTLKQGSLGARVGGRRLLQDGLVVAQVALSVMLLVGATLLLASVYRLQRVDTGFRTERVLTATAFGNFSKYPDVQSQLGFMSRSCSGSITRQASRRQQSPTPCRWCLQNPNETPFDIEGRTADAARRPVATSTSPAPATSRRWAFQSSRGVRSPTSTTAKRPGS